jgi:hypothetical protein
VIDRWTHDASSPTATYPRAAQIYFNVSTGSPYNVILASARLQLPPGPNVPLRRSVHLRAYTEHLMSEIATTGGTTTTRQPDNATTRLQVLLASNLNAMGDVQHGQRVLVKSPTGRYMRRRGDRVVFESTRVADSEWILERVAGAGSVQYDTDIVRLLSATDSRRVKLRPEGYRAISGSGDTSNFRLSWGCKPGDDCVAAR